MAEQSIDTEWIRMQREYGLLYSLGLSGFVTENRIDLSSSFNLGEKDVNCIDEGIQHGLHLAGSGILLASVEQAADVLQQMGATSVTSHEACGAAGLAAAKLGISPGDVEKFAQDRVAQIAGKAGVKYDGHILLKDMHRPAKYHNAVVAYFDEVGGFNRQDNKTLPPGFVINAGKLPPDVAFADLQLAVAIGLGDHGFGKRFTPEQPFKIIQLRTPGEHVYAPLRNATEDRLQAIARQAQGRVQVEQFTAPLAA